MITAECWNGTSHTRFSALLPPWGPRLGSRRSWSARRPASPVPTAVALPGVRRGRGARRLPGSRGGGPAGPAQPEPSAPSSPRAASRSRGCRSPGSAASPDREGPAVRRGRGGGSSRVRLGRGGPARGPRGGGPHRCRAGIRPPRSRERGRISCGAIAA